MDRREFIKLGGAGLMTLYLSGCGLGALNGQKDTSKANAAGQTSTSGGGKKMKIVVVTGSPHKAGTSALLADKFIEGAQAAVNASSAGYGHDCFGNTFVLLRDERSTQDNC
jgi:hypothetical protein